MSKTIQELPTVAVVGECYITTSNPTDHPRRGNVLLSSFKELPSENHKDCLVLVKDQDGILRMLPLEDIIDNIQKMSNSTN